VKRLPNGTLVRIQHPTLSSHPYNGCEGTIVSWVVKSYDEEHYYKVVIHGTPPPGTASATVVLLPQSYLTPADPRPQPVITEDDIKPTSFFHDFELFGERNFVFPSLILA